MRYLRKCDQILHGFEKGAAIFLFSSLILLITLNIILRNIFQLSFQNILEISPNLVLWLALVGSSLALKERRHIKLEILLRLASQKIRIAGDVISSVFGMAVMGTLFYASFEFVGNEIKIFGSQGLLSIIFPLFFCASFFRFFLQLIDPSTFLKRPS